MSERDRAFLKLADVFENKFVQQGKDEDRSIEETLDIVWDILTVLPEEELKRVSEDLIKKYHPNHKK